MPEAVNADDKNDAPNEDEETCAEKKLAPPAGTEDVEDVVEAPIPILPTMNLPEAVNADDKNDAPNEDRRPSMTPTPVFMIKISLNRMMLPKMTRPMRTTRKR